MDLALGMMMTAVGLFQEAETPLGHVKTLDPADMGGEAAAGPPKPQDGAQGPKASEPIVQAIATAFRSLERLETRRGAQRGAVYDKMRQTAAKFEGERRGGM